MMDRTLRNLRVLVQAQSSLLEQRLGRAGLQAGLLAGAVVACLFALGMLDVAGFLALSPSIGPAWAAGRACRASGVAGTAAAESSPAWAMAAGIVPFSTLE